jgi:BlaI family transcriptional regulator, penicillinase repressor
MKKSRPVAQLGARERQILDVIFRLQEASVADVLAELPDPPSYSSVRTMIRLLEKKGYLQHRADGAKYVYRPTQSVQAASKSALRHMLDTFFQGSPSDALAAMLNVTSDRLTDEDLARMKHMIERARREER